MVLQVGQIFGFPVLRGNHVLPHRLHLWSLITFILLVPLILKVKSLSLSKLSGYIEGKSPDAKVQEEPTSCGTTCICEVERLPYAQLYAYVWVESLRSSNLVS